MRVSSRGRAIPRDWISALNRLLAASSDMDQKGGQMPADWPAIEHEWQQARDKFLDKLDHLVGEHLPF